MKGLKKNDNNNDLKAVLADGTLNTVHTYIHNVL